MAQIVPTVLTNNEEEYRKRLLLAEHVSDLVQVDIIDGKFADNQTVGPDVIKKVPTSSMIEAHLLVNYPQNYIDDLMFADHILRIIVPFEGEGVLETLYHIRNHDKQVGLSINPSTPVGALIHLLDDIDFLLLLAVEPGFSGQRFQENVIAKVKEVKKLSAGLPVEVDGGVNFDNVPRLVLAGADFLAVNSALFRADDFKFSYEKLAKLALNPQ